MILMLSSWKYLCNVTYLFLTDVVSSIVSTVEVIVVVVVAVVVMMVVCGGGGHDRLETIK